MTGSLPPNLILSLIFGLGQVIVGAWLAGYSLAPQRRRQWRLALMLFVGLWFVVSGLVELFVSGMETSQRLHGAPSAVVFTLWRAYADSVLFVASAILALGAVIYPLLLRWREVSRAGAEPDTTLKGERGQ